MKQTKLTRFLAPALLCSTILAAPVAFADRDGHGPRHHMPDEAMCERLQSGEAPANREDRRERMEARWAEMADRLQLTEEQRQTWTEIHEEQKQEWQERRDEHRARLMERCEELDDK
ncbi:Spy/CpxP family protein refolding chaperone [Marinobacter zhejiangensis]|uniref:LTXXQ motif family protein n=1 Tax=Marinobacter zhejiangensis TaxID=488535 RepID=A0A1I4QD89_9GAMM|nr:Spy/CpxP family protein refolding chaperone [Marinobacter zhejiangensis]SFM37756.1 LTXXQ motif family protein [Marinobacter zhejiangensis]